MWGTRPKGHPSHFPTKKGCTWTPWDQCSGADSQVRMFGALPQQRTNSEPRKTETCTSGFVRGAGSYPVMIPPNSVSSVAVTGPACGPTAMIEPLSVPVPGNIQVANTLINASKTCFHIQVVNPTSRDVWLKRRTRLGTVHSTVTVTSGNQ